MLKFSFRFALVMLVLILLASDSFARCQRQCRGFGRHSFIQSFQQNGPTCNAEGCRPGR